MQFMHRPTSFTTSAIQGFDPVEAPVIDSMSTVAPTLGPHSSLPPTPIDQILKQDALETMIPASTIPAWSAAQAIYSQAGRFASQVSRAMQTMMPSNKRVAQELLEVGFSDRPSKLAKQAWHKLSLGQWSGVLMALDRDDLKEVVATALKGNFRAHNLICYVLRARQDYDLWRFVFEEGRTLQSSWARPVVDKRDLNYAVFLRNIVRAIPFSYKGSFVYPGQVERASIQDVVSEAIAELIEWQKQYPEAQRVLGDLTTMHGAWFSVGHFYSLVQQSIEEPQNRDLHRTLNHLVKVNAGSYLEYMQRHDAWLSEYLEAVSDQIPESETFLTGLALRKNHGPHPLMAHLPALIERSLQNPSERVLTILTHETHRDIEQKFIGYHALEVSFALAVLRFGADSQVARRRRAPAHKLANQWFDLKPRLSLLAEIEADPVGFLLSGVSGVVPIRFLLEALIVKSFEDTLNQGFDSEEAQKSRRSLTEYLRQNPNLKTDFEEILTAMAEEEQESDMEQPDDPVNQQNWQLFSQALRSAA